MVNTLALRVTDNPAADEEIERQVVHPTSEQEVVVGEEQAHVGDGAETPWGVEHVTHDQVRVEDCEQSWDDDAGDDWRAITPAGSEDEEEPAGQDQCASE